MHCASSSTARCGQPSLPSARRAWSRWSASACTARGAMPLWSCAPQRWPAQRCSSATRCADAWLCMLVAVLPVPPAMLPPGSACTLAFPSGSACLSQHFPAPWQKCQVCRFCWGRRDCIGDGSASGQRRFVPGLAVESSWKSGCEAVDNFA